MSPFPVFCKNKQFVGHVSGWLCKWLDWVYCYFTSYFVQVSIILTSRWYFTFFMWILLRPHDLFYAYLSLIPAFFIFHQVVEKSFRSINHVLQTNESSMNQTSPVLSLCIYSGPSLGKMSKQAKRSKKSNQYNTQRRLCDMQQ